MGKLGKADLGATVFFASSHPSESCGSNGLPLTPNSIKVLGRFQILKTIEHRHLCKYVNIVRGKHERLIVVAEHYKQNLKQLCQETKCVDTDTILQIAYEALQGLACLNKKGLIHRCLAPENILLDKEGHVKLTKYGLYHMTDGGTCVSFPIGFPKYLPPEVLATGPVVVWDHQVPPSVTPFGSKVDVWSLGIILLEAALGIDLWPAVTLEKIFHKILSFGLSGLNGISVLDQLATEHGIYDKLQIIPDELKKLLGCCLTVVPNERLKPEELLAMPMFYTQRATTKNYDCRETFKFPSIELRCRDLQFPIPDEPLDDDHLGQRSIEEVYFLWQLAGGDLDAELKRQGILKSMPPICTLPKIVIEEGEFFGQKRDRAYLLDETFIVLPLDQLRQRITQIKPEAFYPLIEDSIKPVTNDSNGISETASLPLVIREKDIEYQFHRLVLYERLLKGYPYKRPHILREAKVDIPPLYRAHIWAALLDVNGDVQGRYDSIDKETLTITDRQIEVDIPRCHQYDELLSSPEGHGKFKRLLKAWVVSHPQYVYWQGLDSLCAPFLYLNFNDEALAYACLSAFISKYLHKFFLKDNSLVIQEYLAVFSHLIAFHDPELTNHLNSIGFIPELYSIPWFLTMYTHVFPLHKIFHLWDTLLLGNPSFPLCIGVAILQQLRGSLMSFGFNECILLFSDMPEIDIETCVRASIKIFCSTPKSATYRQYERPTDKNKKTSNISNERLHSELEMEPIPLDILKSELSPRISAVDLLELLDIKGVVKKTNTIKPKVLVVDVRLADEFLRGAIPDSINIPFQTAFSPDGSLNPCPEVSKLNSSKGRLIIVVGKRGNNAVHFADLLVRLGYQRVCTLHKGIDVLRSTGVLVVPAAEL